MINIGLLSMIKKLLHFALHDDYKFLFLTEVLLKLSLLFSCDEQLIVFIVRTLCSNYLKNY